MKHDPIRQVWFRPAAAVVGTVVLAAVIRYGPWAFSLPDSTSPWLVGLGAAIASIAAVLTARILGLHRVHGPRLNVPEFIDRLAELAERAKSHGILAIVPEPIVQHHEMLRSGLHLLLRDPDQELVRSVLESESEERSTKSGGRRQLEIWLARGLAGMGVAGAIAAVTLMVRSLLLPQATTQMAAVVIGAGVVLLALGWAVSGPAIAAIRAGASQEAFQTRLMEEVVLSIRDNADGRQTRERLEKLTPSAAAQPSSQAQSRRAA